ncbi:DNA polymerase iota, partial [Galemys pyrenaicus]
SKALGVQQKNSVTYNYELGNLGVKKVMNVRNGKEKYPQLILVNRDLTQRCHISISRSLILQGIRLLQCPQDHLNLKVKWIHLKKSAPVVIAKNNTKYCSEMGYCHVKPCLSTTSLSGKYSFKMKDIHMKDVSKNKEINWDFLPNGRIEGARIGESPRDSAICSKERDINEFSLLKDSSRLDNKFKDEQMSQGSEKVSRTPFFKTKPLTIFQSFSNFQNRRKVSNFPSKIAPQITNSKSHHKGLTENR